MVDRMTDTLEQINGTAVLVRAADGRPVHTERDVLDLIGDAGYQGAHWVAVPAELLDGGFFDLTTGVAGEFTLKFANYRLGLAVLGDITPYTAASQALRAFVAESNRGGQLWFVADLAELRARLAG